MGSPYETPQWVLDQIIETIANPANPGGYDIYIDILAQNQASEQNPHSEPWINGPPATLEDWATWAAITALQHGATISNVLTVALDVLISQYWRHSQGGGGKSKKGRTKKKRSKKRRSKKPRSKKPRSKKRSSKKRRSKKHRS